MPKIVEVYGKDCIRLNENSINVTIPYNILEKDNYVPDDVLINNEFDLNAPVNAPVNNTEKIILNMCVESKSILEIAEYLGYRDKRTVRKYIKTLITMGRLAMTLRINLIAEIRNILP